MPMMISFRDVLYKGKSLCDCLIKKDMNLEEALSAYCEVLKNLQKETRLDQVNIGKLGIKKVNALSSKNLLTDILNALIDADVNINKNMELILTQVENVLTGIEAVQDEKVKASASDTTAGFLDAKISAQQEGCIEYTNTKIILKGFVPIGAVMMINKSRLVDFDNTGKGKIGTDVYGWAIGNGSNGTTNRLGHFPRYAADPTTAGNKAGADSIKLEAGHIPGFTMAVTGTISDAFTAPVTISMSFNTRYVTVAGSAASLLEGSLNPNGSYIRTASLNLRHSHSFDLKAERTNNNVTAIDLIPKHILEIPIERIPV